MNTITVTPENLDTLTDFPQVADHLKAIATPVGSNFQSLDTAESYLRGAFPNAFVYRGGSHVALHLSTTTKRILLVEELAGGFAGAYARVTDYIAALPREEKHYAAAYAHAVDTLGIDEAAASLLQQGRTYGLPVADRIRIRRAVLAARLGPKVTPPAYVAPVLTPEAVAALAAITARPAAPQAPQAPTVRAIEPNDPVDVFVNQGVREAFVLAVIGDEYLVEYTMPKGTTALTIFNSTVPAIVWKGKSYPNPTKGKSVSYTALSRKWLQAIVDAGTTWEGRAQSVYRAPNRHGYGGSSQTIPSAADLLAAKGRK